jgi:NADPH:quinone reductase-like Zn-dependent oxidoreductase
MSGTGPPEVLELRDVDTPVPGDRDLLIRMVAASVNRSDWEGLIGKPLYARMGGLRRPRRPILGSDVAGRVVEVGSAVESFRPGDEVFGDVMYHGGAPSPNMCASGDGAHRPQAGERLLRRCIHPSPGGGHRLPGNVGERRAGGSGPGQRRRWGSGRLRGADGETAGAEVTGVDNGWKQEFMRSLGADHVLDYAATDYTKTGIRYDLILDLVCERSMFAIRRAVAPGGRYAVVGGSVRALLSAATLGRLLSTGGRRIGVLMVRPNKEDLIRVGEMVAAGTLQRHDRACLPPGRSP